MTTKTPTRKSRTIAMAAAVALAGSALMSPALVANAAELAPPAAPTKADNSGYKNDSFTAPATSGVTWTYKVGSGAAQTLTAGTAVKPYASLSAAPAATDLTVTVIATPVATDDTFTGGSATATYPVVFTNVEDKFVAPKAPAIKVNKESTFSDVILPKVAGVKYAVTEYVSADGTGTGTVVTEANAPTDGKAAVKLTNTTNSIKVVATADAKYTFVSEKAVVNTEWVFGVKTTKKIVATPTLALVVPFDNPGTKDWVEIKGVEGVQYAVGTKKVNVKKDKVVKVARAKDSKTVVVTASPVPGYAFTGGSTTDVTLTTPEFTDLTTSAAAPTITGKTVTVAPNVAVKAWTFTGSDNKVLKLTIPKGMSSATFTVPAAGAVTAVANAGYDFSGGTVAKTGKWAVS